MGIVNKEQLSYFAQEFYGKIKANFDVIGSATTAETNSKTYADGLNTAMDTRVNTLESAVGNSNTGLVKDVAVLKGDKTVEGSVAYQIAAVVAGADASFDTLKEIADWITNDTIGATQMANDIKANSEAITDLEALVGEIPATATASDIVGYIQEYVQAQLTGADLSQYAKATDLKALEDKVTVAEGEIDTLQTDVAANASNIATNTQDIAQLKTDVSQAQADIVVNAQAIVQAEASAKAYADGLSVNYATAAQGATADANAQAIAQLQLDVSTNTTNISNNATDITNLTNRVTTLETNIITKADVDEIISKLN